LGLSGKTVGVAIPDTVLEERDNLRDKTVKLGTLARAFAIYGVDFVEVFRDDARRGESRLITNVLEYLETPQYLRRRLYALDESLKFAGLLPPLRIPSHRPRVPMAEVSLGEVREGVTNPDGTVEIGLEKPARYGPKKAANRRVTTKVIAKDPLTVELIEREEVVGYWGYAVRTRGLEEVFSDDRYALKVATSRFGNSLQSQLEPLKEAISKSRSVLLIFGSPSRGLFDICGPELTKLADYVVNLFPDQHVETVRTEEAVFAALNLVNILAI